MIESSAESSAESTPEMGAEDSLTGLEPSLEPKQDQRANDSLSSPDLEDDSERHFPMASQHSVEQAQNRAVARVVAESLSGIELGKYLPDGISRERREKMIKAEAMWLSGVNTPDEIAQLCAVTKSAVYAWSLQYHWKKRADIAQLGQDALRAANMVAIAAKARAAVAASVEASNKAQKPEAAGLSSTREKASSSGAKDDGVVNLLDERNQRPMSEEDAARAALLAQAAADAQQNTIMSLFVDAISKLVAEQQDTANILVSHGTLMARDLADSYRVFKEREGKTLKPNEMRAEIGKQLPLYRQLVAALTQAITLQRRVWMIADAKGGASGDFGDGFGDGYGQENTGSQLPVPVQQQTYEATVIAAEKQGKDLTRDR